MQTDSADDWSHKFKWDGGENSSTPLACLKIEKVLDIAQKVSSRYYFTLFSVFDLWL